MSYEPRFVDGTPICTEDRCPEFDGKRCRMIGFKPDRICEPAVIDAIKLLQKCVGDLPGHHDAMSIDAQTVDYLERIGARP